MKKVIAILCALLLMITIVGCAQDTVDSLGNQAINVADQYINGKITGKAATDQLDAIANKFGVLADQSRTNLAESAKALALKLKVGALKLYIQISGDVLSVRNEIAAAVGVGNK
jgi:hypothetical protein